MKNQGRQKLTRYHLVSQKARHCEPVRTLAWQSRGASAFLDAVTGATREWLPIDIPAPRPCSAPFLCPFSAAGVLCESICAYSSLHRLFWDCTAYYSHKPPDLSTIICPFGANRSGRHPKMPRPGGVRTKRSRFPGRVPPFTFVSFCGIMRSWKAFSVRSHHNTTARISDSVQLCRHNPHPVRGLMPPASAECRVLNAPTQTSALRTQN